MKQGHRSDRPVDGFLDAVGDVLTKMIETAGRTGRSQMELVDLAVAIVSDPDILAALEGMGKAPDLRAFHGEPAPAPLGPEDSEGVTAIRVTLPGREMVASTGLQALLDDLVGKEPNAGRAKLLSDAMDEAVARDPAVLAALARMKLQPDDIKAAIGRAASKGVLGSRRPGQHARGLAHLGSMGMSAEPALVRAQVEAERSGRREIEWLDLAIGVVTTSFITVALQRAGLVPDTQPIVDEGSAAPFRGEITIRMSRPVRDVVEGFIKEVGLDATLDSMPWMYLRFLQRAVESDPAVPAALARMKLTPEAVELAIRRFFRLPM